MMRTWAGWYACARTAHLDQGGPRPLLIVLDCKGGPDARIKAARTRRLLHATGAGRVAVWPDEATRVAVGAAARDLAVTLFQMIETGSGDAAYYADVTQAVLTLAITAPAGPPADGAEFLARLDPAWLAAAYRDDPGPLAAVRAARAQLPDIGLRYRTLLSRLGPGLDGPGPGGRGRLVFHPGRHPRAVRRRSPGHGPDRADRRPGHQHRHRTPGHPAGLRRLLRRVRPRPLWQLYERGRSLGIGVQVSAQSWQGLGDERG